MYANDMLFEEEVRRIARARWPDMHGGASKFDGKERDGIFTTEEMIHVVEATTSSKLYKAESDCKKLMQAVKQLRIQNPYKGVKGWFVTEGEPTADQRDEAKKYGNDVNACSFATFCSALVNSRDYLMLRGKHQFGSAADPETGSLDVSSQPYIEVNLYTSATKQGTSIVGLLESIKSGTFKAVLLGDFGAGKSMTLRELFLRLEHLYLHKAIPRFPLHLNLREHQGQSEPDEALHRHAKKIGFESPNQLVRAWRAGFVDIILDGFDEIATSGWTSLNKRLTKVRYSNMTLVRNFVNQSPSESSLIIAGRQHYFDSAIEMKKALGIGASFAEISIGDFTDEQAQQFIKSRKLQGVIPQWLPPRPLLIGYLMSSKILTEREISNVPEDEGWDYLLGEIAQREARIEADLDGETIRDIVERLATIARSNGDGLGRFTRDALAQAFTDVCGYAPGIGSDVILLRLPGIGNLSEDDGTRSFIDEGLADVASAGDVARFVKSPFSPENPPVLAVQRGLGSLGASVAALQLFRAGIKAGNLRVALQKAERGEAEISALQLDIFTIAQSLNLSLAGDPLVIDSAYCEGLTFDEDTLDYSNVTFSNCIMPVLTIERTTEDNKLPRFSDCYIGLLQGRTSAKDVQASKFERCEIEAYSSALATTTAILSQELPLGVRTLFTVLEKLFLQAGRGRKEGALYRGLDHRTKSLVPQVMHAIAAEGVANEYKVNGSTVWMPARKYTGRIRALLSSPNTSQDTLLIRCKALAA